MKKVTTINEYIAGFPKDVQKLLRVMRATIRKAAPKAEEGIAYGLATYKQNGNLVHFGAFKNHIGFYTTPSGNAAFERELAEYEGSKGAVKFPLDQKLPLSLITKMVKYRIKENVGKAKAKAKK